MARCHGACKWFRTYIDDRVLLVSGVVTTLAGSGTATWTDGVGAAASFNNPYGVSVDSNGAVYVSEFSNHRIRKVLSSGL